MELKVGDFVQVEINGLHKMAKVLGISENSLHPIYSIEMVEDGSETLAGGGVLEKINIFSLMKTNCPKCGTSWSIKTEGVNDIRVCNKCERDGESLCLEFRKAFLQEKKS